MLFSLGSKASIHGDSFRISGRIRFAYEGGHWDEWYIEFNNGRRAWLQEDDGQLTIFEPTNVITNTSGLTNVHVGNTVSVGHRKIFVTEVHQARVTEVEGSLPYRAKVGDSFKAIDGVSEGRLVSLELDDGETEVFEGSEVSWAHFEPRPRLESIKKTASCGNCGTQAEFYAPFSKFTTCNNCKSNIDQTGKAIDQNYYKPPKSILKIGAIGKFDNKPYKIVGVRSYTINGFEYEDSTYNKYKFDYDEWTLISEEGDTLYLEESEEGFKLGKELRPQSPKLPNIDVSKSYGNKQQYFNLTDSKRRKLLTEYGTIRTVGYYGENTYIPTKAETINFAEHKSGSKILSVDWTLKDGQIEEIEFFETRNTTYYKLLRAFDEKELSEEWRNKKKSVQSAKSWAVVFMICAVTLVMVSSVLHKRGDVAAATEITIPAEATTAANNSFVIGPFELTEVGKLHKIVVDGSRPAANTWYSIGIDILNEHQLPLRELESDFWYETGRDSDGTWYEHDTHYEKVFRLQNPGSYYLRLWYWPDGGRASWLKVKLLADVYIPDYFAWGAVLLFTYAYICLLYGRRLKKRYQISKKDLFIDSAEYIYFYGLLVVYFLWSILYSTI